jgi:hypothetical protein
MFTPATDYNQQLLAYLQNLRQLLEQWTAGFPFPTGPAMMPTAPFMPSGGQFLPPTAPFMAPTATVPPTPPAPADYTQQLFSYLQAWRQYLEQMTGAPPSSPPAPTAQPPTAQPGNTPKQPPADDDGKPPVPPRPPDVPIPPGNEAGSRSRAGSESRTGSRPPWPPPQLDVEPSSPGGSQVVDLDFDPTSPIGPVGRGRQEPQVLIPPGNEFATELVPFRFPADPAVISAPLGSSFHAKMARVEPEASPQLAPQSHYSSPGAQAASARFQEAGQKPSP